MKKCLINQNFFDEHTCSSFVLIKNKGLLLEHIEKFELPYDQKINIGKQFQYGTEIEFARADLEDIYEDIKNSYEGNIPEYSKDWFVTTDESITVNNEYGGEVQSPISYNTPDEWEKLIEICDILKENGALINDECSIHLHIDFDRLGLTREQAYRLLKLWAVYEDVIYKFAMGESDHLRSYIDTYAYPIRNDIIKDKGYGLLKNVLEYNKKHKAIQLVDFARRLAGKNCMLPTIEFRIANGTLNPKIIQNITRFFCQLVNSTLEENPLLDYYVNKHFDKLEINYNDLVESYEELNFDKALELVDIIGLTNHDKLCFLKQYLKPNDIEKVRTYK